MKRLASFCLALLFGAGCATAFDHDGPSDSQIRQILVQKSIASYEGSCACPYSRASNGSECGKRSAYNKSGGERPMCFPGDISADAVKDYRLSLITDDEIRQILVSNSVAAYDGNCACPYSTMSNGRQCGKRSAYAKAGGDKPMCYAADVPQGAVMSYRQSLR